MNNPKSQLIFTSYGYELAFMLQMGGYWLESLYHDKDQVFFSEWSNKVNETRKDKLDKKHLRWLWKTIVTEPMVQNYLKKERLISYNEELKLKKIRIPILPKGEIIAIFLKNYLNEECPIADCKNISDPDGQVILNNTLEMQPGKEDFFECCEVEAELNFQVNQTNSVEQEANFLELDIENIKLEGRILQIKVDSLNHAYKLVDRRISQQKGKNKKSPGGSIYKGNLAWISNQQYISLGKIRQDVEEGEWIFPGKTCLNEKDNK